MALHPKQKQYKDDLESGARKIDDDLLDCAQSYTVFKFQPEIGAFSACCDADLINYDHESFLELGAGYFDKHPDLVQRKLDLRNNIKNKQCSQCWKKEDQGIKSMRQTLAPTDSMLNHQNPYLGIDESYPNRIELWMNSTCNLGCFMCHIGNSNTLRKIWHEDYDTYGNDGKGFTQWLGESDFTKNNMHAAFIESLHTWSVKHISDQQNDFLAIAYLGGEPTLHSEMFDHADSFIEASKDAIAAGCKRKISITTNGTSKDKLNERFYTMFQKYKSAGWQTDIMLSQDGVDEASQVRHGANSVQIMKNYNKWISPDSVLDSVNHFTVLSNLNFPYAHNLFYQLRDSIDENYASIGTIEKRLSLSFNACIAPTWMQIKYLPKRFAAHSAEECIKVYEYLKTDYNISMDTSVFDSVLNRIEDNPTQDEIEYYFQKLHYVQSVYRKTYPTWSFYKNFPHLVEFANDYGIERE
jgi:sulfatase maturation enzyme AslB (radical SAM superfamily)